MYDQYRILRNEEDCKRRYDEEVSPLIKEGGYTWEKALESMRYIKTRYSFLILRQLLGSLLFDFAIIYF